MIKASSVEFLVTITLLYLKDLQNHSEPSRIVFMTLHLPSLKQKTRHKY